MKKIKVEVTATDIKKGRPRASNECPVALAVIRVLKKIFGEKAKYIGVCRIIINMTIDDGEKSFQYVQNTPKVVSKFINKFDAVEDCSSPVLTKRSKGVKKNQMGKKNAKPFNFLLRIPSLDKKEKKTDWHSIHKCTPVPLPAK